MSTKTTGRKSGARKRKTGARQRHVAVVAHSVKTGFTHFFVNITRAQAMVSRFKRAHQAKHETDLVSSIAFWTWIKGLPQLKTTPNLTWSDPVFRLTAGWPPLSIAGSLSDGGRFNVGGAQLCPELPDVNKSGAIYAASTLQCCYREISGNPLGRLDAYKLTPKKTFWLWDLTKVIAELNYPSLEHLVKMAPFEAIWAYQKVPMISQLLAHYLRGIGGDGIAFPSTKDPTALNLCFFFNTDDEAQAGLSAQLSSSQPILSRQPPNFRQVGNHQRISFRFLTPSISWTARIHSL